MTTCEKMDPKQGRLAQAKHIFADAVETPAPQRPGLLDRACAGDAVRLPTGLGARGRCRRCLERPHCDATIAGAPGIGLVTVDGLCRAMTDGV